MLGGFEISGVPQTYISYRLCKLIGIWLFCTVRKILSSYLKDYRLH